MQIANKSSNNINETTSNNLLFILKIKATDRSCNQILCRPI